MDETNFAALQSDDWKEMKVFVSTSLNQRVNKQQPELIAVLNDIRKKVVKYVNESMKKLIKKHLFDKTDEKKIVRAARVRRVRRQPTAPPPSAPPPSAPPPPPPPSPRRPCGRFPAPRGLR